MAAIGPGTAAALAEHGITADVVPERFVAEGLVEALADVPVEARARGAGEPRRATCSPTRCVRAGSRSTCSRCMRRSPSRSPPRALAAARQADYITFTSSSTVRFFLEAWAGRGDAGADARPPWPLRGTRIVSIGPVTSETLREHGLEPHVEAERHDIDGVVEALLADAEPERESS